MYKMGTAHHRGQERTKCSGGCRADMHMGTHAEYEADIHRGMHASMHAEVYMQCGVMS